MGQERTPLRKGAFHESLLLGVSTKLWPNEVVLDVYSVVDGKYYKFFAYGVLEVHWALSSTCNFTMGDSGMLLRNVFTSVGKEYQYWKNVIEVDYKLGYTDTKKLTCIELLSDSLRSRTKSQLGGDDDSGILIACRELSIVG